ncbi:MAG: hypothetical protein IPH62_05370 [Ignavibacteriae bacterium]|nr:hypothetical protein [Ignavibacteriota bacterium]
MKLKPQVFATVFSVILIPTSINAQTYGNIKAQLVEKGTTHALNDQEVKIYYNGNTIPTTEKTNKDGTLDITTGIEEETETNNTNKITYTYNNEGITINKNGKLTIYTMGLGEKVLETKIEENKTTNIGQLTSTNYTTRIEIDGQNYTNKITIIDGIIAGIGKLEQEIKNTKTKLFKTNNETTIDSIIINSPQIAGIPQVKDTTIIDGKTYPDITDLGLIELEGKNVIKGYIYDLETNEPADNGKVFLKSTPTKTYDLNNGWFEFTTTQNNTDTIKITMPEYYNITHPINIQMGTTNVYGINDNQGLFNIKIQTDNNAIFTYLEDGIWKYETRKNDYMEYLQDITDVRHTGYEKHQEYNFTKARFKENPVKVWINRADAPNEEYSNTTLDGIMGLENNNIKFEETTDKTNAQLRIVDYNNPNLGNGVQVIYDFDEQGPYLKQWDISLNKNLPLDQLKFVTSHEAIRSLFVSTYPTSPFISDVMYSSPLAYMEFAIDGALCSEKEKTTTEWIYKAPRNTKWLEYSK